MGDTNTTKVDSDLESTYRNPKGGYMSARVLYSKVRQTHPNLTFAYVTGWLEKLDAYTMHKPSYGIHDTERTFVKSLGEELQVDLVDLKNISESNDGYKWIFMGVEILSRFAFARKMRSKKVTDDDNKEGGQVLPAMINVLAEFKRRFGKYPDKIHFDEGLEFNNKYVMDVLRRFKIKSFTTFSDHKAAVVERLNRTIRTRIWTYFTDKGTKRWVDILDDVVAGYNSHIHSSTGMKPEDVDGSNEHQVWLNLYSRDPMKQPPMPTLGIGDQVRSRIHGEMYGRGYTANYTNNVFVVYSIHRVWPTMYGLVFYDGEKVSRVEGRFYQHDLSRVRGGTGFMDDPQLIKTILATDEANTEVPDSDVRIILGKDVAKVNKLRVHEKTRAKWPRKQKPEPEVKPPTGVKRGKYKEKTDERKAELKAKKDEAAKALDVERDKRTDEMIARNQ